MDVETPAGIITSVIATRSVQDLRWATKVLAVFKSTEVLLAKI